MSATIFHLLFQI